MAIERRDVGQKSRGVHLLILLIVSIVWFILCDNMRPGAEAEELLKKEVCYLMKLTDNSMIQILHFMFCFNVRGYLSEIN